MTRPKSNLFRDYVRSSRLWRQVSVPQLAEALGIPADLVIDVEAGDDMVPDDLTLVQNWARALGIDEDLLLKAALVGWGEVSLGLDTTTLVAQKNACALALSSAWETLTDAQYAAIIAVIRGTTEEPLLPPLTEESQPVVIRLQ